MAIIGKCLNVLTLLLYSKLHGISIAKPDKVFETEIVEK